MFFFIIKFKILIISLCLLRVFFLSATRLIFVTFYRFNQNIFLTYTIISVSHYLFTPQKLYLLLVNTIRAHTSGLITKNIIIHDILDRLFNTRKAIEVSQCKEYIISSAHKRTDEWSVLLCAFSSEG